MKQRILIKNILFTLVSIILLLSALGKFAGRDSIVTLYTNAGMGAYITRIAVIQLIIVGCLLWKPLRSLGVLVASAFLGGVIFMMMGTECSPLSAGITLIMLWVAYKLEWWGYWHHHDQCGCGWCKRKAAPRKCNCKGDVCTC